MTLFRLVFRAAFLRFMIVALPPGGSEKGCGSAPIALRRSDMPASGPLVWTILARDDQMVAGAPQSLSVRATHVGVKLRQAHLPTSLQALVRSFEVVCW